MMSENSIRSFYTQAPPGHDPTRDKAGCRAVLEHFRSLPRNLSDKECPSSLELIRDGRFGQRPVNRINDLVLGKYDGHRYDFERIRCGRGEYHWRLHEPNRAGYPKDKQQTVLPLESSHVESPQIHKARRSADAWKPHPIVPTTSFEEWDRRRNEPKPVPDLVLMP